MKLGKMTLVRDTHTEISSLGKLSLEKEKHRHSYICETLEDVPRSENIKIPGKTAIPTGLYKVILTMSSRFKRVMPMIFTEKNGYEIKKKGVSFKGVRFHGGNDPMDSAGCPLVAFNRTQDNRIYGTAEKRVTELLMGLGLRQQTLPLPKDFDYVELLIING